MGGLLEEAFGLFEKALADWVDFAVTELSKFLEFGLLGGVQSRWHFHQNAHVQVAKPVALNVLDPFAFERKNRSGLCPRRNLESGFPTQGGYLNLRAKRGLHEVDRHLAKQIAALAPENFMRFNVQADRQV